MGKEVVQAQYEALDVVAQRFAQQAETQRQLERTVAQSLAPLQSGGWIGRGSQAFFAEMRSEVAPTLQRLIAALQQAEDVSKEISQVMRQAEEEAGRLFHVTLGNGLGMGGAPGGASETTPPPRVYIVNGINSTASPGSPDANSIALKELLGQHGFDPNNVKTTPAIYLMPQGTNLSGTSITGSHMGGWLSPVDWLTGKAAAGINMATGGGADLVNSVTGAVMHNGLTGAVVGSAQVAREYAFGEYGPYTQSTYAYIQNDLRNNPLLPGQSIVLMGHSGGGAIVSNMAGMIERNLGYNVSGVVTAGSPLADYSEATPYAEHVVEMSHGTDWVHHAGIPAGWIEKAQIAWGGGRPVTELSTDAPLHQPFWPQILEAHGSYMKDGAAADSLYDIFAPNPI